MKSVVLGVVAAMAIASSAAAADWRAVNANSGGVTLIDLGSVRADGPLVTGWVAFWLLHPEDDGDTDYMLARVSISCSDGAMAFTALNRYRANGSVVASNQLSAARTVSAPDTNGDKIVKGFCDGQYGEMSTANIAELFTPEQRAAAGQRARAKQ
ncbi:surface-adhesin E family protein [Brevundimonas phoenicis]|uniref:surface-adhesin E family protein n=1 Tax=unclassified Brevundimonas TaxID=2622653 RepID=UPI0039A0BB2C